MSVYVHQHLKHLFVASSNLTGIKVLPVVYLSSRVEISFKFTVRFPWCTKKPFTPFDSQARALCCILCPLLSLREFALSETITFLSRQRRFHFSTKPSHKVVVSTCLPRVSFHSCAHHRWIKLQHQESQTFLKTLLALIDFFYLSPCPTVILLLGSVQRSSCCRFREEHKVIIPLKSDDHQIPEHQLHTYRHSHNRLTY